MTLASGGTWWDLVPNLYTLVHWSDSLIGLFLTCHVSAFCSYNNAIIDSWA